MHVMRHGEVHNPDKILYGRLPDYHLSERGQAQAKAVADWLAARDITHVVASPLERAQETAAPIAARHGLAVGTDDELIESANIFQGQRVSPGDGALRDPRNWWHLRNPHPIVGRAVQRDRRAHDAGRAACGGQRLRSRSRLRQPSASRRDTAPLDDRKAAAPLSDPAHVQPGVGHVVLLPRRRLRGLGYAELAGQ